MTLHVRPATLEDFPQLHAYLHEVSDGIYADRVEEFLTLAAAEAPRNPHFILGWDDDAIIGTACYTEEFFSTDVWGISLVTVEEAYRSNGLAARLVTEALKGIGLRLNGRAGTVILNTYPNKTGLYEKLDFQPIGLDHAGGSIMIRYLNTRGPEEEKL